MIIESGLCGNTVRKYKTMVNVGRISKVRVMNWMLGLDVLAMEGIFFAMMGVIFVNLRVGWPASSVPVMTVCV